jgi:hypothetical protein
MSNSRANSPILAVPDFQQFFDNVGGLQREPTKGDLTFKFALMPWLFARDWSCFLLNCSRTSRVGTFSIRKVFEFRPIKTGFQRRQIARNHHRCAHDCTEAHG